MPDGMSLQQAARNLLWLHRERPDLFAHVLSISEEDMATLRELADDDPDEEEEP
jgi:hypothetical protein